MQKQKGNIAETAVIHHLAKLDLPVFKEIGDSVSVDLITLINKKPITIQVKYAEIQKDGSVNLNLRKTGPNGYIYYYQEEDFDLFALYVADMDKVVWINAKEALAQKSSVSFRAIQSSRSATNRMIVNYLDIYKALNYAFVV